jgi:hypothetical protein
MKAWKKPMASASLGASRACPAARCCAAALSLRTDASVMILQVQKRKRGKKDQK